MANELLEKAWEAHGGLDVGRDALPLPDGKVRKRDIGFSRLRDVHFMCPSSAVFGGTWRNKKGQGGQRTESKQRDRG